MTILPWEHNRYLVRSSIGSAIYLVDLEDEDYPDGRCGCIGWEIRKTCAHLEEVKLRYGNTLTLVIEKWAMITADIRGE